MSLISKEIVDALAKDQNLDVTDDVKKLIVAAINKININPTQITQMVNDTNQQDARRRPSKKTLPF